MISFQLFQVKPNYIFLKLFYAYILNKRTVFFNHSSIRIELTILINAKHVAVGQIHFFVKETVGQINFHVGGDTLRLRSKCNYLSFI